MSLSKDDTVFHSPISTEDLVLNAGALEASNSGHASLLPEHLDPASSLWCMCVHVCMCMCVCVHLCVHNAVWRERRGKYVWEKQVCGCRKCYRKCSCCITVSSKICIQIKKKNSAPEGHCAGQAPAKKISDP